ncbi:hypothetical protein AALO_G00118480 [Alosa alosa]|uniref:Secreted protein n=1 Tax=Alosa alosa TaxID=278164 RepID=A0AAV6GQW2_9TELE|nr:hypothetical protein AALO_G00118480 [Alosa alosa]
MTLFWHHRLGILNSWCWVFGLLILNNTAQRYRQQDSQKHVQLNIHAKERTADECNHIAHGLPKTIVGKCCLLLAMKENSIKG